MNPLILMAVGLLVAFRPDTSARTNYPLLVLRGHEGEVLSVTFSSDGKLLASGDRQGRVCVWDVDTGKLLKHFQYKHAVEAIWVDSKTVSVFGPDNTWSSAWDLASGQQKAGVKTVPLSYVDASAGDVRAVTDRFRSINLLKDGRQMRTLPELSDAMVTRLAITPDTAVIASGYSTGKIILWETETGKELHRFSGHERSINKMIFAAQGRYLVSSGHDPLIKVWDVKTGRELRRFRGHGEPVFGIALSPDGRTLASADGDRTVRLWRMLR